MPTTQGVYPTEAGDTPTQVSMEIMSKLPTQIKLKTETKSSYYGKRHIFLEQSKHKGLSYSECKLAMQKNNSVLYKQNGLAIILLTFSRIHITALHMLRFL